MCLKEKQLELETLYNKNQQIPKLTKLYKEVSDNKTIVKLLVQLAIRKRLPIGVAIGILSRNGDFSDAIKAIEVCVEQGAVKHQDDELIVLIQPSQEIEEALKLYMFPPPMLVKPRKLTNNRSSGYLKSLPNDTVLTRGSHTDEDVCLDVLNILNSFTFTLNLDVLNISSKYKTLIKMKEGESVEDYRKRFKQWEHFDRQTRQLIESHYMDVKTLHFVHRYDSRGRVYCHGYNLNYQGHEWSKALIQFEPEKLRG